MKADKRSMIEATEWYASEKPIRVSIFGKMRSGKDTIGRQLVESNHFLQFAYGDELKRAYHDLFGYGNGKDREGYQWFGQTMRGRYPDVWVDILEKKMRPHLEHRNIVITDMRQPNEYEQLRELGFLMVKVHTPDEIRLERMRAKGDNFTEADLTHETESYIDSFDYDVLIENTGTIGELIAKGREAILCR